MGQVVQVVQLDQIVQVGLVVLVARVGQVVQVANFNHFPSRGEGEEVVSTITYKLLVYGFHVCRSSQI